MAYEKLTRIAFLERYMQEMDLDCFDIASGPKGFGKSSKGLQSCRYYSKLFDLECDNSNCNHYFTFTGKFFSEQTARLFDNAKGDDIDEQKINRLVQQVDEIVKENCPKCGSTTHRVKEPNFRKFLAWDNDEIDKKIKELPPYSQILGDEAVNWAMGEDWMKYENKNMKKVIAQCRPKHIIFRANIPKFGWMDKKYRCDMATSWTRIVRRSLAVFLIPDLGEGDDSWHMKDFIKILGEYTYFTSWNILKSRCQRLVQRHPCAFDWLIIPPVPEHIYKQYLKVRNEKVFERKKKEDMIDQKATAKLMVYNLVNNWEQLIGAVKASRFEKPTLKLLEKFVLTNPKTEEPAARYTTIRNWLAELNSIFKRGQYGK